MNDCIFCKIIRGELPSYKIYENNEFLAFLDRFPEVEGMAVIVSKEHLPSYFREIDRDTLSKMIEFAKEVSNILDNKLENVLRTKLVFEGLDIDHLHLKLYPIYKGVFQPSTKLEVTEEDLSRVHLKVTS